MRQLAQVGVQQTKQLLDRAGLAPADGGEQCRYLLHGRSCATPRCALLPFGRHSGRRPCHARGRFHPILTGLWKTTAPRNARGGHEVISRRLGIACCATVSRRRRCGSGLRLVRIHRSRFDLRRAVARRQLPQPDSRGLLPRPQRHARRRQVLPGQLHVRALARHSDPREHRPRALEADRSRAQRSRQDHASTGWASRAACSRPRSTFTTASSTSSTRWWKPAAISSSPRQNPAGPWSDPVWLKEIDGIDPSFFFDDDGKAYIVNNGPPEGTPLYDGSSRHLDPAVRRRRLTSSSARARSSSTAASTSRRSRSGSKARTSIASRAGTT